MDMPNALGMHSRVVVIPLVDAYRVRPDPACDFWELEIFDGGREIKLHHHFTVFSWRIIYIDGCYCHIRQCAVGPHA